MLDIAQLRYIVEVEKAGSISKAASNLFISQPYISRLIKEVENSMGIVLFTRGKQGMEVTPEGEEFIYYARAVLAQYDQLTQAFQPSAQSTTFLRIAAVRSSHIFEAFVEYLYRLQMEHQPTMENRYEIDFCESNLMDVIESVASKNADVGLLAYNSWQSKVLSAMAERRNMTIQVLSRQRPYVIVSANHPLARRGKPVKLSELYQYGTVCYGDRWEGLFNNDQVPEKKGLLDLEKLPMVINVYDRASQLNLLSYTDCFIIGICSFDAQDTMYNMVSLPIDTEGNADLEDYVFTFALITLNSKHQREAANEFVDTAVKYFERFTDVHS